MAKQKNKLAEYSGKTFSSVMNAPGFCALMVVLGVYFSK